MTRLFIPVLSLFLICSFVCAYDAVVAKNMLIYSSLAYCPPEVSSSPDSWFNECREPEFQILKTFRDENTTGFAIVGADATRIVVSFKGSNGTRDFHADFIAGLESVLYFDFNCKLNDNFERKVHWGFCTYYQSIQSHGLPEFVHQLFTQAHGKKQVYVTGHSLGGALASLFTADIASRYTDIVPILYTYGAPRVGDFDFSKSVEDMTKEAYRIVHSRDMVPHLPKCCFGIWGAVCDHSQTCPHHPSEEAWYFNDMTDAQDPVMCTAEGEDPACSLGLIFPTSLEDHLVYFNRRVGTYCCPFLGPVLFPEEHSDSYPHPYPDRSSDNSSSNKVMQIHISESQSQSQSRSRYGFPSIDRPSGPFLPPQAIPHTPNQHYELWLLSHASPPATSFKKPDL
eukprot:TRINITY_DN4329_c0_g1::TRINITY_DN4329_c0_g1_i1::g.21184::m.21184 TRINITY_DN4329_c0_g1::TRINITY_DN4329_c0_g1_i1::g.21184  ORF type:complete len:421 (+),score=43.64,sp/P61872/LIP_RHIOR/31.75/5e-24,Lipase_3/PF01764.20/8.7e-31,Abhydrolase_1/PF00561.15/0.0016,Abhydrolase_6/PF12697.2/0.0041,Abhydrolase_5/PF12695.2/0.014,PGAP1/PF07819.8/0.018,DUF2974/PF11187.3/3.5e+03,DUF2974/PF11187.3/0.021,Abhydrolase_3/PF07859.8/0.11,DUF2048/PF09752.4/0.14 TRINITY_DN4329_c0_g1_i1:74-1264(+)